MCLVLKSGGIHIYIYFSYILYKYKITYIIHVYIHYINKFSGENRNLENKNDPCFYCSKSSNPDVVLSLAKN